MAEVDEGPTTPAEADSGTDRSSKAHGPKTEWVTTANRTVANIRIEVRIAA